MYLEISCRRSGKTSRLLEAGYQWYTSGSVFNELNVSIFVAPKVEMARCLQKEFYNKFNLRPSEKIIFTTQQGLEKIVTDVKPPQKVRCFYDEFDSFREAIYLNQSWYYVTTPTKIRSFSEIVAHKVQGSDDALLNLLDLNGGKHDGIKIMDIMGDMTLNQLKDIRQHEAIAPNYFDTEWYAKWY